MSIDYTELAKNVDNYIKESGNTLTQSLKDLGVKPWQYRYAKNKYGTKAVKVKRRYRKQPKLTNVEIPLLETSESRVLKAVVFIGTPEEVLTAIRGM